MSLRVEAGFEHLKDAIAEVFAKEVEFPRGMLVTVLGAKVTANTAHAKIVLSVFPKTCEQETLRALNEYRREIKEGLSRRLRLRRIPNLHYTFDATEADAAEIEETIKNMNRTA